jgi:6,7-dimethyl-8-ribityllumazine synthase
MSKDLIKGLDEPNLDLNKIRSLLASGQKIAIVAARFNANLVNQMVNGALAQLQDLGINKSQVDIFRVPGAFELPLIAKKCAASKKYAGIIAFGVVIKGDTDHYNYICTESTRGLMKVMLKEQVPVAMGVLTTDNLQQAQQRAEIKQENKGAEVTRSLLEMIDLTSKF